jgi:signal transduction histidine kinase/ABC-type uncharacterized transport system substrate-binding protein/CheY-like chemotaxis protein
MLNPFSVHAQKEILLNTDKMENDLRKKVLIINSYHQGHPWTDGITKGILNVLKNEEIDVETHIQNMDTKRILNTQSWGKILSYNLSSFPPGYLDLIITTDDNATFSLFTLEPKLEHLPVVYCGITNEQILRSDTSRNFIGFQEYLPFKENIDLALKLFPNTQHIAIVTDNSRSGIVHKFAAEKSIASYNNKDLDYIWLDGSTGLITTELMHELSHLPDNTIVLFSIWQVDGEGRFWDPLKYYSQYVKVCNSPMFTTTDVGIHNAFLGGLVTVSEKQGELAAQIAVKILNGTPLSEIKDVHDKNEYIFNYKELKRWNISQKDLPENSIILNKPLTVYNQYKTFFFLTLSLIILLFVLFWILLLYHFRYRNYELQRTEMANKTTLFSERYRIMFEESNNAIVIFELKSGVVRSFNEKALELFKSTPEEFYNYNLKKYIKDYDNLGESIDKWKVEPLELELQKSDLTNFYAQIIINLMEEDNVLLVYAIINDITVRRNQEEEIKISKARLTETLLNSRNSYWEWDLENNTLHKDESFWLALDIDPATLDEDPLDGEFYINAIHPFDKKAFEEALAKAISGESDTILQELRMDLYGKETWVEIRASMAKRDEKGIGLGINGFMMNINDRKKQEEELINAKVRAEESDRLKSAFISNISHEIRTPLNGIVGFSNLLGRDNLTLEDKRKYLSFINENNDLLLKLINDILEISKIETDSLQIHNESCNLMTLCEDVLAQERLSLSPTVTLSLSEVQSINVMVDRINLTQILSNLISNAKKYTKEGRIEVGFKIVRDKLEFSVRDTGIGIDESMHDYIFERFTQVDPFSTGTGLGLPITKAVVEKMGGDIWVESSLGKGACFYFTIKYQKAKINIFEIEPDEAQKSKVVHTNDKMKTVLIAEDDESSFVLLNVVLIGKYHVIRAINKDEIIDHIQRYSPDILIADLDIPDFSVDEIKEKATDIKIIGISDNPIEFAKDREEGSKIEHHLSKPINIKNLMEILDKELS